MPQSSGSAGSYPILKSAQILQIMVELEIPLTESELAEPGRCKERVREVLTQLLCNCWGVTPDQLNTISSRTQKHLTPEPSSPTSISSHPQLYQDAFTETKFFCLLQKLMKICGYDDFGFLDLAAPNGRRFKRQLSACINLMRYREDMNHLLTTVLDDRAEMFGALEEVAEEHMVVQDHLNKVREINQAKLVEREEAELEGQEMQAEIAQQNKIQSSIRQENHLLQKSANELKDQIANLSIALRELQAEERQLNKEVVHSPDHVKADVHKAERDLDKVKVLIGAKEDEKNVLGTRLVIAIKAEECVKNSTQVMEDVDGYVQEYEVAAEDGDDARTKSDEVESCLDGKKAAKEEKCVEIRAMEEQNIHHKTKLTKQLEASKEEFNSASNKLGVVEEERLDGIARIESRQKLVEELEADIKMQKEEADEELRNRVESFHKFASSYLAKRKALVDCLAA